MGMVGLDGHRGVLFGVTGLTDVRARVALRMGWPGRCVHHECRSLGGRKCFDESAESGRLDCAHGGRQVDGGQFGGARSLSGCGGEDEERAALQRRRAAGGAVKCSAEGARKSLFDYLSATTLDFLIPKLDRGLTGSKAPLKLPSN
jgi:hypothetical protein